MPSEGIKALRLQALAALQATGYADKVKGLAQCQSTLGALHSALALPAVATLRLHSGSLLEPADLPGQPLQPVLLTHTAIAPHSLYTAEGLPRLLHAVTHSQGPARLAVTVERLPEQPQQAIDQVIQTLHADVRKRPWAWWHWGLWDQMWHPALEEVNRDPH